MCSTMCVQHLLHKSSKTVSHLNMIDLQALDENVLIGYNYRQELYQSDFHKYYKRVVRSLS